MERKIPVYLWKNNPNELLVISQFTYLLVVLPTPGDLLFKLYEQNIFNFIWNGKPDKIKWDYLYNYIMNSPINY